MIEYNYKIYIFYLDCATFVGYSVVSRPFFNEDGKFKNKTHNERLEVILIFYEIIFI